MKNILELAWDLWAATTGTYGRRVRDRVLSRMIP